MEMVEVKTEDLLGAELDWATMKTEGDDHWSSDRPIDWWRKCRGFRPSIDWADGGPMIQAAQVSLECYEESGELDDGSQYIDPDPWIAKIGSHCYIGATPLIAACRAIVHAKLGETVLVPKELVK